MLELTMFETRVLGALIEKSITTPDQYPLSLNALCNACNQKSNRDPVMALEETQTQDIINSLIAKRLVAEDRFGSRVLKFKQRFYNTEFSEYHFNAKEIGVLCVLFLRGSQTPGELRGRTQRLCQFTDVTEVEKVLEGLINKEQPLLMQLEREPGKRESRYMHLFSGVPENINHHTAPLSNEVTPAQADHSERIDTLEKHVLSLQEEIQAIKDTFDLS